LDYGENPIKPDLSEEEFCLKKQTFLDNIRKTPDQIAAIEKQTILQTESGTWMEIRRNLLTASNFYSICTRKLATNRAPLIKRLIYSININSRAVKHGKNYEPVALKHLETELHISIKKCGLFIHTQLNYLGKMLNSFLSTVI